MGGLARPSQATPSERPFAGALAYAPRNERAGTRMSAAPRIGELNERSLHRALKQRYAAPGSVMEQAVDGFVADIRIGDRLIEIHTGAFSRLKRKLPRLLERFQVKLVYPIARDRFIVKLPPHSDAPARRRKSPKHEDVFAVFAVLPSIPALLEHPNLTLDVVMTVEEDVRRPAPGRWRRDWVRVDRRLVDVLEVHHIGCMAQLYAMLAPRLPIRFTTRDLARAMRSSRRLGQQAAFCLREAGVSEVCGKEGNALVYRVASQETSDQASRMLRAPSWERGRLARAGA